MATLSKAALAAFATVGLVVMFGFLFSAVLSYWGDQAVTIEEMEAYMAPVMLGFSIVVAASLMFTWGESPKKKRRKPQAALPFRKGKYR